MGIVASYMWCGSSSDGNWSNDPCSIPLPVHAQIHRGISSIVVRTLQISALNKASSAEGEKWACRLIVLKKIGRYILWFSYDAEGHWSEWDHCDSNVFITYKTDLSIMDKVQKHLFGHLLSLNQHSITPICWPVCLYNYTKDTRTARV